MGKARQDLIAIDVLLVPDRKTMDRAISLNALLRSNYPAGYALATRIPHLTLLQRFVPVIDLGALTAAVVKVLGDEPPTATLTATGIESVSFEELAVASLAVERTLDLMRLHQKIIDAVKPFSVCGGGPLAFADPEVAAGTVDWVETFVPKASGENFQPHITIGTATEAFVAQLKAAPFQPFSFKADRLAIYQVGNFGTAAKKLF